MTEVWHRFTDYNTAPPLNLDGDMVSWAVSKVHLCHETFPVIRHTLKGVWLDVWGQPKWVSRHARKRWACPTRKAALISFKARKRRQIGILEAQAKDALRALSLADDVQHGRKSIDPLFEELTSY